VASLTSELVRRGHRVTLFASSDSQTDAELVGPIDRALRLDPAIPSPRTCWSSLRCASVRAIHCHIDYLAFQLGRMVRTPTIHILHGRLDLPYYPRLFSQMSDVRVVSISDAQRAPLRGVDVSWVGTVYHGLALEPYTFSEEGGGRRVSTCA